MSATAEAEELQASGAAETAATTSFNDKIDRFLDRKRTWIAVGSAIFAMVRVLLFAAFFPLFNQVDEPQHYDTVYRYAHGQWPGKELPKISPEAAEVITLYGSPEYLDSLPRMQAFHRDLPVAELAPEYKAYWYAKDLKYWRALPNTEMQSPPVYYLVAAGWYKLGELGGAKEWRLAYWVRFLNAGIYGLFVWVAYLFVKEAFGSRSLVCAGVPLLLAVMPQDVFYGMNRDVMSPVLAGAELLFLFRGLKGEEKNGGWLVAGGLLTGAAFLSGLANVVVYGALAAILALVWLRRGKEAWRAVGLSALAAVLPAMVWAARNRMVMGDWSGSAAKIAFLGWTVNPLSEIVRHPLFTVSGFSDFATELTRTGWRGELVWAGLPMKGEVADGFYVVSSFVMLAGFAMYLVLERKSEERMQRVAALVSLFLAVSSVLFLVAVSLPFDYHDCAYPSRRGPFFVSGRIICGALLPFAIIYVRGWDFLWRGPLRRYLHPIFPLLAVCCGIMASEVMLSRPVFSSAFNFFALRRM